MAYVYGTNSDDVLNVLDTENDYIYGYEGNDILNGLPGDDYLDPGTGVDTVDSGDGNDLLQLNLYTYDDLTDITVTYTAPTNGSVSNSTTLFFTITFSATNSFA